MSLCGGVVACPQEFVVFTAKTNSLDVFLSEGVSDAP